MATRVAGETGLPAELVEKTYRAYWRAVREHICSLPLKEASSWDELRGLKPCVNIPRIGKLVVTGGRFTALREGYGKRTKEKSEDNAAYKDSAPDVHGHSDHGREV